MKVPDKLTFGAERVHIREKKLKDGRKSLFLDYSHLGKRKKIYLGLIFHEDNKEDKARAYKEAETYRTKQEKKINAIDAGIPVKEYEGRYTLLYRYAELIASRKRKANTARNYLVLAKKLPKDITLADVNRLNFNSLLDSITKDTSENTKHLYGVLIRALLNQAETDELIPHAPNLKKLIEAQKPGNKEHLTRDELQRILDIPLANEAVASSRQAFLFACYTSLRYSDIASLRWEHIKRSVAEDGFEDRIIVKEQIKTSNEVQIPLSPTAEMLLPDEKERGLVFENLSPLNTIERHLKKMMELAHIDKHITFHCARHTFAVLTIQDEGDLYGVSQTMGHTDLKTTQVYTKFLHNGRRRVVNRMPPLIKPASPEENHESRITTSHTGIPSQGFSSNPVFVISKDEQAPSNIIKLVGEDINEFEKKAEEAFPSA
ncbi:MULTISPECIES: site-specific integrase [unclassified Fibrobacter]|uniref:site-specific integrase n=1 Tax=unclassified Fibrobacter TaxID=2634177 RepID=UPI00091C3C04|nr:MULTISPECIES: site-specific integrase [unclassified Fibrobacter]OWV08244.1 hypothetical protein B7993_01025 [Fibrobacter sp. UWH3]SHL20211.1 Site-specific recombinase XerD [Fibrobacter sp. UWH6]